WRELASLNYSVRQNDGRMLSDDHWIEPGWTLVLPPATGTPAAVSGAVTRFGSPDPPSRAPAGAVELVAAEVTPNSAAGWTAGAGHAGEAPVALIGAGLLGAGVVRLLDRMRRTQQRRRVSGGLIKLPDRERSMLERRLRSGDGDSTAHAVDLSLKLFARGCVALRGVAPLVFGVEVHPDEIELLLEHPMDHNDVPEPFGIRVGQPSVSAAKADLAEVTSEAYPGMTRARSPFPTLVTLGTGADGPRLVNIEAVGSLALVGDPSACEGIVRALALELATSQWAGQFELVLVGFGDELARFDRVRTVTDTAVLLHQLHYRRLNGEVLLESSSFGSFAHARMHEDADTWDPLVVVCSPGAVNGDFAELVAAASNPRTGTAVIAPGPGHPASHVWDIERGELSTSLDLFGSFVLPQSISSRELADVGALVTTAADCVSVTVTDHPYGAMSIPMPRAVSGRPVPATSAVDTPGSAVDGADEAVLSEAVDEGGMYRHGTQRWVDTPDGVPDREVEVAILGPVEVRGAEHQFTRAWAKELVVYLAMHPRGASNDAWATALWPDRLMAPSSLHSTASVARRSLGHAQGGQDHLPRAHGRLQLAKTVGTDWDRFVRLTGTNGPAEWRKALGLIRGRPFDGLRASDWPILEGIAPAIEAAVVDVAGRLAGLYLQQSDAAGAEWAARKGLLVSPYDERLYRMLMRAADRAGNPAGVESVMSELIRLVADEVEPFDSVHPSTMELYRSLSRRKKMAAAAV
ncbi:MAG: AfsR/SARP family transcriptional regulator, partial [Acidimicrobiales bacterium]